MNPKYAGDHIIGVIELALGRETGLDRLDCSVEGFYRSFWAAIATVVLIIPIDLDDFTRMSAENTLVDVTQFNYVVFRVAIASVALISSLVSLYLLCRTPQTQSRFSIAVIGLNWLGLLTTIIALPLLMAANRLGEGDLYSFLMTTLIFMIGVSLFALWRVTRTTLMLTNLETIPFFVVPIIVQIIVEYGLSSLFGLPS